MKYKEKAYSIALASTVMILFLILVSATASASPEQNPLNTTTPPSITSGAGDPSTDPVLSEGISSLKSAADTASTTSAAPKITETRITTDKSDQYSPVIHGNKIVWKDDRNGNWDIYIYDLSTKKQILLLNTSIQWDPDIYGDRVVWMDNRNGNWDIYMQDLATKKQTRITTDGAWQISPAIYGDKIVWQDIAMETSISTCTTSPLPKKKG